MGDDDGRAEFAGVTATGVVEVRHDVAALDEPGFWVVVDTFEGELTVVRMRSVQRTEHAEVTGVVAPLVADPDLSAWSSSLDRSAYERGVRAIRDRVAAGDVYQVNLCRVLSRAVPAGFAMAELDHPVRQGNPAPRHAYIDIPEARLEVVCASPELYLQRSGDRVRSAPIKGTAPTVHEMLPKDRTENVMITDLVRNDLSAVCRPGTVAVDALLAPQHNPGLVHLESTVSGVLQEGVRWADILGATFPPGSVSGAPKSSALRAIRDLEPVERGPYCGAIGYVDNDTGTATLAVGIRTFWLEHDRGGTRWLRYGTGAGITWGSDPEGEWWETALKARRLLALAETVIARSE
ncbi:anthranilate synthase component I family protein [Allobranchiibius sp. CTAmp26]|uniref:chorismate-binding protein n=1 Tax=Allobranchiibius sp. CTAmp26 TaxID=2815214 RepID=UPI001AA1CEF4|nr:anthranilate synthase component I family protein [Allobranchiibius sp. CTAmp26]MBO1755521.1 anthranilate synthase component I family protein [Allobranchiibius sp. CTAmp26]